MNEVQKELLMHLRAALFGGEPGPEVTGEVLREAIEQAVHTLLPIEGYQEYWKWLSRNVAVTVEHQRLHEVMTKNNIPYAAMKGAASAAYYPDPDRRVMGDVDFIVRPEDIERARAALEAEGFTRKKQNVHHMEFQRGKSDWELHWQPPGFPADHVIQRYIGEMVDKAVMGRECMVVCPFHHGLIVLTHNAGHMQQGGIGLRHICDWVVFASSFSDEEFRAMFEQPLREVGLWRYAQLSMQLGVRFLGAPERAWAGRDDDALLDAIMQDVLDGGNFGLKDENRSVEGSMMPGAGGRKDMGNELLQLLHAKAACACQEWPVMGRWKVLIPFGMAFILLRRGWRILRGERQPIRIGDAVEGAKKRKAIYREFALFEPEK